jgi:hypothetical protein
MRTTLRPAIHPRPRRAASSFQISPAEELRAVEAAITKNMQAMQGA